MFAQTVSDTAGDGPGPHHRIEGRLILNPGAKGGGDHVKQAANDVSTRRQTG